MSPPFSSRRKDGDPLASASMSQCDRAALYADRACFVTFDINHNTFEWRLDKRRDCELQDRPFTSRVPDMQVAAEDHRRDAATGEVVREIRPIREVACISEAVLFDKLTAADEGVMAYNDSRARPRLIRILLKPAIQWCTALKEHSLNRRRGNSITAVKGLNEVWVVVVSGHNNQRSRPFLLPNLHHTAKRLLVSSMGEIAKAHEHVAFGVAKHARCLPNPIQDPRDVESVVPRGARTGTFRPMDVADCAEPDSRQIKSDALPARLNKDQALAQNACGFSQRPRRGERQ